MEGIERQRRMKDSVSTFHSSANRHMKWERVEYNWLKKKCFPTMPLSLKYWRLHFLLGAMSCNHCLECTKLILFSLGAQALKMIANVCFHLFYTSISLLGDRYMSQFSLFGAQGLNYRRFLITRCKIFLTVCAGRMTE